MVYLFWINDDAEEDHSPAANFLFFPLTDFLSPVWLGEDRTTSLFHPRFFI